MVALAIAALVVSSLLYAFLNSSSGDAAVERSEEYYRQYAMLEAALRRDIRNAVSIESPSPGEYRISSPRGEGHEVVYKLSSNGKVVQRKHKGGTEKYDFTGLIDKKFVFVIDHR